MTSTPLTIYEDTGYRGASNKLGYGSYSTPSSFGMPNDSISSLKVGAFTKVTIYDDTSYDGKSSTITGPKTISDLGAYSGGYEDLISSIRVSRNGPSDTEKMACCQGTKSASECADYKPGSATCNTAITNYCNASHMGEQFCKTWCRGNTAACDSAVVAFCDMHPADPYCACLKSPANIKGVVNPKCADRNCLDTGYITTGMKDTMCPPQITCEVKNTLINSGVILSNTTPVQQNCGTGGSTSSSTTTIEQAPPGAIQTIGMFISQHYILVFLFIMLIFAALIAAAILSASGP